MSWSDNAQNDRTWKQWTINVADWGGGTNRVVLGDVDARGCDEVNYWVRSSLDQALTLTFSPLMYYKNAAGVELAEVCAPNPANLSIAAGSTAVQFKTRNAKPIAQDLSTDALNKAFMGFRMGFLPGGTPTVGTVIIVVELVRAAKR